LQKPAGEPLELGVGLVDAVRVELRDERGVQHLVERGLWYRPREVLRRGLAFLVHEVFALDDLEGAKRTGRLGIGRPYRTS
jgi:hypothetical protein